LPTKKLDALLQETESKVLENRISTFYPDEGPLRRELYVKHMAFFAAGLSIGKTDTLRGFAIEAEIVARHAVHDCINAVRRMLDRTWIDEQRCARGLDSLRQYRREWDDRLNDWKSNPRHDWTSHSADAPRIFASAFENPRGPSEGRHRHGRQAMRITSPWAV
jgi:hypothetical protein